MPLSIAEKNNLENQIKQLYAWANDLEEQADDMRSHCSNYPGGYDDCEKKENQAASLRNQARILTEKLAQQ